MTEEQTPVGVTPADREEAINALCQVPGNPGGPLYGTPGFWPYFGEDDPEDRAEAEAEAEVEARALVSAADDMEVIFQHMRTEVHVQWLRTRAADKRAGR